MSIVRTLPDVEAWLDADADSWSSHSDREYKAVVRRWFESFARIVQAGDSRFVGNRAILSLDARLPADVHVFSGVRVPQLANMGGLGASAYQVSGLRRVPRDTANRFELIVVSVDFDWSCVFSHEAGAFVWEHLYERGA